MFQESIDKYQASRGESFKKQTNQLIKFHIFIAVLWKEFDFEVPSWMPRIEFGMTLENKSTNGVHILWVDRFGLDYFSVVVHR